MEQSGSLEETATLQEKYSESLEKASKESPALIKRMSNTISDEQKAALINPNSEEFNPDFDYPNLFDLDEETIAEKTAIIEEGLTSARTIENQGFIPSVLDGFVKEKATVGLLNLQLLRLAQKIQVQNDEEKEDLTDEFMKLDEKITGSVDPVLYQGIVNSLHELSEKVVERPNLKKVVDELTGMLQEKGGDTRIAALPDEIFEQYQHAYKTLFGGWLSRIIPQKEGLYAAEDMASIYSRAIDDMKMDQLGWKVEIDEDATSMRVSMEKKTVTVPSKRKPLSYEELVPKVVHEIGHMIRGWNGSHISHRAEHGLPDYLDAEEGLMSYGEQFISGKRQGNATYIERYLGAGMMTGVDGVKRDFKQVFAVMWRARILLENSASLEDITEEDIKSAREDSLMNAQRLFRGGDGKIPGVGWTKDKSYYEGSAKLTNFLVSFANRVGVENINMLFIAKFDPTNQRHSEYLELPLHKI